MPPSGKGTAPFNQATMPADGGASNFFRGAHAFKYHTSGDDDTASMASGSGASMSSLAVRGGDGGSRKVKGSEYQVEPMNTEYRGKVLDLSLDRRGLIH